MATIHTPSRTQQRPLIRSPLRLTLAVLGVVCVGLGLVGIVVPGLPTTIFLIAASFLFARSCPWLEERLLHHRVFAPYWQYLDGQRKMPRRARITATATMWIAVIASLALSAFVGRLTMGFAVTLVVAASIGTVAIARFRRTGRAPDTGTPRA